ncbi:SRPBCC family protein [Streptomyces bauhiniae]|uniref:SRPBCC family protein n=1 Tax=Streptomyces bauhiniae TaxID=2340725 RepID=UPI0037D5E0E8
MELQVFVPVPVDRLREALADAVRVARAVPGLQQDAGAKPVAGRLKLRVGGHSVTYRGTLAVSTRADGTYAVRADGTESRGAGTVTLSLTLTLAPTDSGTTVTVGGTAKADGRLAELPADAVTTATNRLLTRTLETLAAGTSGDAGPGRPTGGSEDAGPGQAEGTPQPGQRAEVEASGPEQQAESEATGPVQAAGAPEPGQRAEGEAARPGQAHDASDGAGPGEAEAEPGPQGQVEASGPGQSAGASEGTGPEEAEAEVAEPGQQGQGEASGPGRRAEGEAAGPQQAADASDPVQPAEPDGDQPEAGPQAEAEPGDDKPGTPPPSSVFDTEVPPPALDPETDAAIPDTVPDGLEVRAEPPAEAAHARRTMIGRSAEEVDHAPPRGRYAPVPAPQTVTGNPALRWAAPAAAVAVASAIVVARALRKRH